MTTRTPAPLASSRAFRWLTSARKLPSTPPWNLLGLGAVLLVLIWAAVLWEAQRIRQDRLATFRQDLQHVAEVLDETVTRQLESIDNALLILRAEYVDHRSDMKRTVELLRRGPLKGVEVHVTVIGRNGYTEFTDIPGSLAPVYLGDRAHFRAFADGGADQLYISEPVLGRLSKRWGLQLSRPIWGPDGRFAGVVVVFLPPEQLTRFIQPLDIGADTIMTLTNRQGNLVSRSQDLDKFRTRHMSDAQLAQYQRHRSGYTLRRSVLDQVERGMAHRWLSAYPLLLLVSRTPDSVYAEIAATQRLLVGLGGSASLILIGTLWLLGRTLHQRARMESRLQQEHDHLVEAQRIARLGSWTMDHASGRLYWSDEVFRIFEIDPTRFQANYQAFLEAIHPADRDSVDRAYRESVEQHRPYFIDHRLLLSDGRIKWVREQGTTDFGADGHRLRTSGTVQDITQRRHADEEMRIAATAFETQEGMFITDENGVILRINSAFTEITGFSAEDIVGKNPRHRSSGRHDAAFYAAMWKRIRSTGAWKGEIWNRRKNGEIYPESVTITAVKDADDTVSHYVATMHDISERKAAEEQIHTLAFYDALTRLPNRRLLQDRLQHAMLASMRSGHHGALLFLDLDKFKLLNDTLGHDYGDLLLQEVAQRLQACVRQADTVARLGGDEFVVLLEELNPVAAVALQEAEAVGRKILDSLDRPYDLNGTTHTSTPSIGVTVFYGQQHGMEELLKQADLAMYQAKGAGRNTLRVFDPLMLQPDGKAAAG